MRETLTWTYRVTLSLNLKKSEREQKEKAQNCLRFDLHFDCVNAIEFAFNCANVTTNALETIERSESANKLCSSLSRPRKLSKQIRPEVAEVDEGDRRHFDRVIEVDKANKRESKVGGQVNRKSKLGSPVCTVEH
jgi:hypothetical protein